MPPALSAGAPAIGPSPAPAIQLSCPASHCECDCRNEGAGLGPLWALIGAALALLLLASWTTWPLPVASRPAESVRTPTIRVLQDRTGDLADLPGGKSQSPGTSTRSTPTPSLADSVDAVAASRLRAVMAAAARPLTLDVAEQHILIDFYDDEDGYFWHQRLLLL